MRLRSVIALTCGLLALLFAPARAVAAPIRVPADYSTIQAAINAVVSGSRPDGSTIEVQPGTYAEALTIADTSRSLTIIGLAGSGGTIVDATSRNMSALRIIRATGVVRLEGVTVRGGVGAPGNGGGFTFEDASPTLVDVVFTNNSAFDAGGGVMSRSHPVFTRCVISNNTAQRFGGGLVIAVGSRPVFSDCRIQNNVSGTGGAGAGSIGSGGGVHINDASPKFRGCIISGNRSKFAAGGVFHMGLYDSVYGVATLLLEDTDVSGNITERFSPSDNPAEGGGVHVEDNAVGVLIRSTVRNNTANTSGGLSAYRARLEVTSSMIEGNHAQDPLGVGGFGGGIGLTSNNVSQPLRAAASLLLVDSSVRGNDSRVGGGLLAAGDQVCGSPTPNCNPATAPRAAVQLTDAVISDNVAVLQAGGIRSDRVDLTLTNSHVLRNSVNASGQSYGGGLVLATGTAATIDGTTIARNTAVDLGGGLFLDASAALTLRNSRVYANSAASGGGLYVGNNGPPSGTVQNSVIADNANYQIHEQACAPLSRTILSYINNTITPRAGFSDLYYSTCGGAVSSVATLNASPSLRSSGNTSTAPSFVSFLSTPDLGAATLSWSVSRASSVTISSLSPSAGDTGATIVTPPVTTTYSLTSVGGPATAATAVVRTPVRWGISTDTPTPGDFDGDGVTDWAIYRGSTGFWYIWGSTTGFRQELWGAPSLGDVPVQADYDGDGRTDIAIFRPGTGQWYVLRSIGGATVTQWGSGPAGDVPIPRDFDGDGRADVAIYRSTTGQWFVLHSSGGVTSMVWGVPAAGDVPVPADYDGDGRADIAVFRPGVSGWFVSASSGVSMPAVSWGAPSALGLGDTPVPADYDGDGKADLAVARAATGDWYVRKSTGGMLSRRAGYGDFRIPGRYAGGAAFQIAIFQGATGGWLIQP